ncbi:MAG: LysR family transcriptional regulator [Pseudomonadota bacterium]
MWDEIQAAAEVAKYGTVSEAAKALKVHRATIIRRIDTLEEHLGRKIFQRHKHGYTPTEISQYILEIARTADTQLEKLSRLIEGEFGEFKGELIITSANSIAPKILRHIASFTESYPDVQVNYKITHQHLNLEEGEAHIAFRHFMRPKNPDYVVLPHEPLRLGLYASKSYINRYGYPSADNLDQHRFLVLRTGPEPEISDHWINGLVRNPKSVLIVNDELAIHSAVEAGIGIGFHPVDLAEENPNLLSVLPISLKWKVNTWIVTHVDLHRSPKVKAFLDICRNNEH